VRVQTSTLIIVTVFGIVSIVAAVVRIGRRARVDAKACVDYVWLFFFFFTLTELFSLSVGVWVLAFLSFVSLREYLTLIDLRAIQDRPGEWGAYVSIFFMYYFISRTPPWYGMFIISIPVYTFLMIPFLVTLGGEKRRGMVFSVGAINFGLFLFVYCLGHVGYLATYSVWLAVALVGSVAVCDIAACMINKRMGPGKTNTLLRYAVPIPFTAGLLLTLSHWNAIPTVHCIVLGLLIPLWSVMGHRTIDYIREDLGIEDDRLAPGRGELLSNMKSFFYAAPVFFHYVRYFMEL